MTSSHDSRKTKAVTAPPAQNSLPSVAEHNRHAHALGQAAFWRPRHAAASPMLGQVPFLFWLTEVTGARLIVQIGLDDGIGYMALCQAAERLSASTICLALDAEEATLPPALQAEHDGHYSDFSQIIGGEKAIANLPEGIDLLVIGAPLKRDGWDLLRDDILPRLSESAVLVVIDPDAMLAEQRARRVLIGDDRPQLTLRPVVDGGSAIDVFLYGAEQPDQLRRLFGQQSGQSSWPVMCQAFNRLGQGIVATCRNRDLLRDNNALQDRLKQAEAKIGTLEAEVEKAGASEKLQHHRQGEMAARVHDLQIERDALAGQVTELVRASEQAERDRKIVERDAVAQLAEMQREVEDARAQHDARIEDIAALTATYESRREEAEKKNAAELAQKEKSLAELRRELAKVSAHRDALLGSTSWKITSPLRKVTSAVRGQ